ASLPRCLAASLPRCLAASLPHSFIATAYAPSEFLKWCLLFDSARPKLASSLLTSAYQFEKNSIYTKRCYQNCCVQFKLDILQKRQKLIPNIDEN
ncbi:MAG: hypothetical protein M3Z70_03540, partial [Bartonella sp.]|nr:hypothetical protein [Bartonella sp.]